MSQSMARLRAIREAQGRTQAEVARKIGYDAGYLSRVERGLQRPSVDFLVAITRELGLRDVAATIERFWETPGEAAS